MGLDMYLSKKYYVKNWDHFSPEKRWSVTVSRGGESYPLISSDKIEEVSVEVAYWRKANQIHRWFVQNVQKGNDDCGHYWVSRKTLEELLSVVNSVLDSFAASSVKKLDVAVAKDKLPSQEGFFFGSTDYDEGYLDDLKYTKEILTQALSAEDIDGEFYYHSSW